MTAFPEISITAKYLLYSYIYRTSLVFYVTSVEILLRIITSSRWWHNFPFSPFSRVSRGKTQACIFSYEIWTSLVSGLLRYYIKIGAFVIWRDARTERMRDFYLQKDGRRNWKVRQKNRTDGKECGSDPLQHFTGWIFPLQIFVVSEAFSSFQQGAVW